MNSKIILVSWKKVLYLKSPAETNIEPHASRHHNNLSTVFTPIYCTIYGNFDTAAEYISKSKEFLGSKI